jgi:phage baseplate assembly protein W
MSQRLPDANYLAFPLRITPDGGATSNRVDHIHEQIEQVLFTTPGERVFRPEFGAGVQRLVFEPNNQALAAVLTRRLQSSLQAALEGEVDPKSLQISVAADPDAPEKLLVQIDYTLAAIGQQAAFTASVGATS